MGKGVYRTVTLDVLKSTHKHLNPTILSYRTVTLDVLKLGKVITAEEYEEIEP